MKKKPCEITIKNTILIEHTCAESFKTVILHFKTMHLFIIRNCFWEKHFNQNVT